MMEMLPIEAADAHDLGNPSGWTPDRRTRFLSLLAESGDVRASALACGLSPQSVYKLRRRDGLFARAWLAALLLARDHSEQVMASRALDGVEEPIFYQGELVGTRRRYDNRLLLAHMARLDRLADDAEAEEDAGRFDELLALVAGERAPGDMAGDDLHLPLGEDDFADRRCRAAHRAKDAELPRARGKKAQEQRRTLVEAAGKAAAAYAARDWQAWFGRACATVDRLDALRARTVSTVSTVSTGALAAAQQAGAARSRQPHGQTDSQRASFLSIRQP
jgi:hypothetical protein